MRYAFGGLVMALAGSLLVTAASCGDDDSPEPPASADAGIGCKNDPRAEQYVANLEHTGKMGMFKFVLMASDPAPPIKGNNDWVVKVLGADGQPVTGATITTVPYMPDHGHGTQAIPVTTPDGDNYKIAPVYLFMPGLWQVTIKATAGDVTDQTAFNFCIQG